MSNVQWGEFKIKDIYSENKVFRKVKAKEITSEGKTPVYSSTTSNQGIDGYTIEDPDYTITEATPFYVIFGDHTRALNIAKDSFSVKDNVKVLTPINYNEKALLFVNTVIGKAVPNLGYSRHWVVAKDTEIYLPITREGNPDWEYMENYIREKQQQVKLRLEQLTSINETTKTLVYSELEGRGRRLDWEEFNVGEFFQFKTASPQVTKKDIELMEDGKVPFIMQSASNNGIVKYVTEQEDDKFKLIEGNTITCFIHLNKVYYQKEPYYTKQGSNVYFIKYEGINDVNAKYIVSVLNTLIKGLGYGQNTQETFKKMSLYLPVISGGTPDWEYIEEFINEKQRLVGERLNTLLNVSDKEKELVYG